MKNLLISCTVTYGDQLQLNLPMAIITIWVLLMAFQDTLGFFPLKKKSDALGVFCQFKTLVENQLGITVKAIQIDWVENLDHFKITWRLWNYSSCDLSLCSPTELYCRKKHKHIVQIALTLLSHAYLPLKFWEEAFITDVYLINQLPSLTRLDHSNPLFTLFQT